MQSDFCAILDDPVIGRFIFEIRLTAELCLRFLQEELLQHLEHTFFNKQVICTSNMTQHLIFSRAVSNYLNDHLPWQWIVTGGTYKLATQVSRPKPIGLLCVGWMKETFFKRETHGSVAFGFRQTALGIIRGISNNQCALLTTGEALCGWARDFRKPPFSTD